VPRIFRALIQVDDSADAGGSAPVVLYSGEVLRLAQGTAITGVGPVDPETEAFLTGSPAHTSSAEVGPAPRLPTRLKDLQRWRTTWRLVYAQVDQGRSYNAIARWLRQTHPDLKCGRDVLGDIIRAGIAGDLDR
jgi:hypothetical protein